eukprot:Tbor_TRINITY_DN5220_c0_g1::TRINITY_DN5220_c0_g1_i2::g.16633::m.16633
MVRYSPTLPSEHIPADAPQDIVNNDQAHPTIAKKRTTTTVTETDIKKGAPPSPVIITPTLDANSKTNKSNINGNSILLKYTSDYRTLAFCTIIMILQYSAYSSYNAPYYYYIHWSVLWLAQLLLSVSVVSIVHNQLHVPIFHNRRLNQLFEVWLSVYYGYPVMAWIPTHILNHHVYSNKAGDFAPPEIVGDENNIISLLKYPSVSAVVQQPIVWEYVWSARARKPWVTITFFVQAAAVLSSILVPALIFREPIAAIIFVLIPQQFIINMVLIFNYIQHVHCNHYTYFNHSRSFIGWPVNFWLFNNGYHLAHHESANVHWSLLGDIHYAKYHDKVLPELIEYSFVWYMFRVYILGGLFPNKGFGTRNLMKVLEPDF